MIGCLVHVIILAIFLVILLIIVEKLLAAFGWADARIIMLVRLLFGILILLAVLQCLGIFDEGAGPIFSFSRSGAHQRFP